MKKTVFALSMLALVISTLAGEKVNLDFSAKWVNSYIKRKACIVKDDVLSICGDTTDKNSSWRSVVFHLPFKSPAGEKFKFGGEIKVEKINAKASFEISIRLIDAKGKSIRYERIAVTKDQDWKELTKTFTAPENTVKMQFYILARNLADESTGSVKDLSIEQL